MELSTWNVKEYRIADPEGNEAIIFYRPITQGWRSRHLESSLHAQRAFSDVQGVSASIEGKEDLSEEDIVSVVAAQKKAVDALSRFQREMLGALVVGCQDLTIGGEPPSVQELVDLMVKLEEPATDLVNHIIEEGTIGDDEGKDSAPPSTMS